MEYILLTLVILVGLFIKFNMDKKRMLEKSLKRLETEWGQVPNQEYTYSKLSSIPRYYESRKEPFLDVDDITWNDLDLEQIFMLLNHTESSIGEEYLYALLRKLEYTNEKLEERRRLTEFFLHNSKERKLIQHSLSKMGKIKDISFYEYINRVDNIEDHSPFIHYVCAAALPLSIASIFIPFTGAYGFGLVVLSLIINITLYYKRKARIENFFQLFAYILRTLSSVEELSKADVPAIEGYMKELKKIVKSFQRFKRGSGLVVSRNAGGSLEDIMLDYVRMLFHVDLIKFDSMAREVKHKKAELNQLFEIIGLLDSMIAAASFRKLMNEEICIPRLTKGIKLNLTAEDIYHPMINEPVKNTISAGRCVLLTGSNASGKSTFIKTIAINSILAQTLYICLGKSFTSNYFKVYSSMALKDDLMSRESYYIVEIKSLKRIYDQSGGEIPLLCFVDEVLRGTNTAERIAASSHILKSLSDRNTLCFAATHDIELTHILENHYDNYHFQEKIMQNEIIFDYKLHKGRAASRNAIKLLGIMGYSEEIITKAEEAVNHFIETNQWDVV